MSEQTQPMMPTFQAQPRQPNSDFEMWRFDINDLIREKEQNLLGYFWDPSARAPDNQLGDWVKIGEARVNQTGAKAIVSALSGMVNKISTLTILDVDEILAETRKFVLNVNRVFYNDHIKFGFKTPSDATQILWELGFLVFNGLKQSQGGAAMKSLVEMSQTIRYQTDQDGGKKGGAFNLFGGGKK